MKKEDFITERTRIISEMLDNPDEHGIYPTTKCFNQLDELFDKLVSDVDTRTEPALHKHIVSQRSELLIAFGKHIEKEIDQSLPIDFMVSEFEGNL
jgi:hypothetical protein